MKINVKKLNIAMAEKCLNNTKLCKKANIGTATLSKIKSNKNECLPVTVGKIAKALNIPVNELIERE